MTTAYRSCLHLRAQGYIATVVEHRRGKYRYDLFGIGDTLAITPAGKKILVQAYIDNPSEMRKHSQLTIEHPMVKAWCSDGSVFRHDLWKKRKNVWTVSSFDYVSE